MAYSSGARRAMLEASYWLALAGCVTVSIVYFDDIKSTTRLLLDIPESTTFATNGSSGVTVRSQSAQAAIERSGSSGPRVELRAGRWGQYNTLAELNGLETRVLVDTGASAVALTAHDAEAAGIFLSPSDYTTRVRTANGIGHVASVMLDSVTIGEITVRDVRALVHKPGTLGITLLGMTFLGKLSRVSIRNQIMVLAE